MILSIWSKLNQAGESIKSFMLKNDQNVLLYTGLFVLGLLIFAYVYSALNKDK